MEKVKTKRVPYLHRFEKHVDMNRHLAANVPVYRMRTVEVDEKGKVIKEVSV